MNKIISTNALFVFLTLVWFFTACKDTNSRQTEVAPSQDTSTIEKPATSPKTDPLVLYAWVDQLRVRAAADKKADIVAEIPEGGQLAFLNEKSDFTEKITLRGTLHDEPWLKVKTAKGEVGWVYGGGVKFYAPIVDMAVSPYDDCIAMQVNQQGEASYNCMEKVRAKQLRINSRWVKETKENVTITLLDGSKKVFTNEQLSMEGDNFSYNYHYYIPKIGYHVLRIWGYEWSGYLLVNDKSGKTIEIYGYPKASPDFRHIVITNIDLEASFEYNGVGLLGFTDNGLEMILDEELTDYGPVLPIWIDNKTVEITYLPSQGDTERKKKKVKLVEGTDGAWTLID